MRSLMRSPAGCTTPFALLPVFVNLWTVSTPCENDLLPVSVGAVVLGAVRAVGDCRLDFVPPNIHFFACGVLGDISDRKIGRISVTPQRVPWLLHLYTAL